MTQIIPSEKEVEEYFQSLSNWGRWGEKDQLGTLNFLTPQKTIEAVSLITKGITISCASIISFDSTPDAPIPALHFMLESGEGWTSKDKQTSRTTEGASDFIGMAFHGYTITHVDSLAHYFWKGKLFNNQPAHLISTNLGATVESIDLAKNGIVTRGVLVDVPMIRDVNWVDRGEGVMPEDILAAEKKCGFTIQQGDLLLIRTGQLHRRTLEGPVNPNVEGSTACQAACLPLFHERNISMLGSDTGNDVLPSQYRNVSSPIHQVGIVAMGLWILDNANLEELSKMCIDQNRWEFTISIGPLRLSNSTGSPVNPLAIF